LPGSGFLIVQAYSAGSFQRLTVVTKPWDGKR
jgi:hypothetical protein